MIQSLVISTVSVALLCLFVYGVVINQPLYYGTSIGAYFIVAPILLDLIFTMFAQCLRSNLDSSRQEKRDGVFPYLPPRLLQKYNLPRILVYSSDYDIKLCGFQKCCLALNRQYSQAFKCAIRQKLDGRLLINTDFHVHKTSIIPRHYLLDAGVSCYKLLALNWTLYIISALQTSLFFIPAGLFRWKILNPMLSATQGTVDACLFALKNGWCINMSGGYHHATRSSSNGFCIYPDITVGIHFARKWGGIKKVVIVDLDSHQGNGHQRDFQSDQDTYILDAYNPEIYPGDEHAKKAIRKSIFLRNQWTDEQYLQEVGRQFQEVLETFRPELVVYNAGTDCRSGDPKKSLNLSDQGIISRDLQIFELCWDRKVPVAMILNRGHQKQVSKVIGDSVFNLFKCADQRQILPDKRQLREDIRQQLEQPLMNQY